MRQIMCMKQNVSMGMIRGVSMRRTICLRRKYAEKLLFITMLALYCLCSWENTAQAAVPADETAPQEGIEKTVEIKTQEDLLRWYEKQTGTGNETALIKKELVILTKVKLGSGTETREEGGHAPDLGLDHIKIKIQKETSGAGGIIRIKGQGSLVIDNPDILITGPDHLISVEDNGTLALNQGEIEPENQNPDTPAIVCRNKNQQIMVSAGFNKGRPLVFGSLPSPVPPEESLPDQGQAGQNADMDLTEALLLSISADGSGTARLKFKNLPSDITALYIYRSDNGKSWTKEKKHVESSSSIDGQTTAEYENFLKEPGNVLNRTIVEDGSLIYYFGQTGGDFYVKARIEWPDGAKDTSKIKLAVPDHTGQGLAFSSGWGGYGGWEDYGGGGYGGGSPGSGAGSYGRSSNGAGSGDMENGEDAPESPARRGRGRGSRYYIPPDVSWPSETDTRPYKTASPSDAAARDGISGAEPAEETENAELVQEPETAQEEELQEEGLQDAESRVSGQEEPGTAVPNKKIQYTAIAAVLILSAGGYIIYLRRKKKSDVK